MEPFCFLFAGLAWVLKDHEGLRLIDLEQIREPVFQKGRGQKDHSGGQGPAGTRQNDDRDARLRHRQKKISAKNPVLGTVRVRRVPSPNERFVRAAAAGRSLTCTPLSPRPTSTESSKPLP